MSNSSYVSYTKISPNRNSPRNHAIDTITIHCIVGQWTAEQGCNYFADSSRQCSANYVVGKDGTVGLCVDEKDRSWCSSNAANDNRAVTIEVASGTKEPYAVTDDAYSALVELVADICKRNGIKKLVWSTNKDDRVNHRNGCNMTVHRDYDNKSCPGAYLYERHADIARRVNILLGAETPATTTTTSSTLPRLVRIKITDLYIRKGPGTNYGTNGFIKPGVYTIVAEQKVGARTWGKLKSGAGWIAMDYTCKV